MKMKYGFVCVLLLPQIIFAQAKDLFPSAADERTEIQKTWRLLARDIAFWNVPRPDAKKPTVAPCYQPPANQVVHPASLITEKDRDPLDVLLRRTEALADDLGAVQVGADLVAELQKYHALQAATSPEDEDQRYLIFSKVMRLRKRIAFRNPLVREIRKLLFITREVPPSNEFQWGVHVCDQFFGFHAKNKGLSRGNGVYVIEEPFAEGKVPVAKSILMKRAVEKGPWKGRVLVQAQGGDTENSCGFLSPDVSWDGREILFSCTKGEPRIREWDDGTVFHIFRCRADGSGLEQLTTGPVNDLFPCWLPNGRVVFCSERRGGFGRCHQREVPNYTLHTMFPDGTDITCISPHETNEFEPSVDNDGRIVYMRWDYVDRGYNQAHHAWIAYPDGRDPRELQGNTRTNQWIGCHAQESIRAIPHSRKYVATAVSHHSNLRGSLVLIDPSEHDDGAMSQLKRITPDQLFPESEVYNWQTHFSGAYATAWPLSEKYYICVYDGDANSQYGAAKTDTQRRKYNLVLLDVFGNKICIYEHPLISCLDPIPLQARAVPPVLPHKVLTGRPVDATGQKPAVIPPEKLPKTALVQLMNVYNSRYPFPEGVEIKALRIWEVLPKTEPMVGMPRLGACDQTPGRQCLGVVPVEKDGSAAFWMKVGVPVYFQALDANGCAVQTMRSDTYVAPGEVLTCNGCHEHREQRAERAQGAVPLAMQRAPSQVTPEVDGSKPFNYPRLVQGVLDAKCISCHGANRKPNMPDLTKGDLTRNPFGFYASFCEFMARGLVQYYTKWYYGKDWAIKSRQYDDFVQAYSEPGKVGARASKLYQMLVKGHHGVKLTAEEMRRLIVFMDAQGAYIAHDYDTAAQRAGKVVEPVPATAPGFFCALEGEGEGVRSAAALPKENDGRAGAPHTPNEDAGRAGAPRTPNSNNRTIEQSNIKTFTLKGPWRVDFAPNIVGTPDSLVMHALVPWKDAFDDSRKYHSARARCFSGKATYVAPFVFREKKGSRVLLDLGKVGVKAAVTLNGKAVSPQAPSDNTFDITAALVEGVNDLRVEVTGDGLNNRIYDAGLPLQNHTTKAADYPDPATPWRDYGLLGPVRIIMQ